MERVVIPEDSGMYTEPITEEMAQAKCEQFYTDAFRSVGHRKCDGPVKKEYNWLFPSAPPYWQCHPGSVCSVN